MRDLHRIAKRMVRDNTFISMEIYSVQILLTTKQKEKVYIISQTELNSMVNLLKVIRSKEYTPLKTGHGMKAK